MQNTEISFRKSNDAVRKKLGIQGFNFPLITLEKTTLLQTRKVCTEQCTLCLLLKNYL